MTETSEALLKPKRVVNSHNTISMINILKGFLLPSVPNGKPVNEDRFITFDTCVVGGDLASYDEPIELQEADEGQYLYRVKINLRTGLVYLVGPRNLSIVG
jgi:hypothetical protein